MAPQTQSDTLDIQAVVRAARSALGDPEGFVPLHAPTIAGNAWGYVKECLDTGWVSSAGEYVGRFERAVAEFTGSPYAVAVVNGTAALHVALRLAGVEAGEEVICPSLTFVATANAITYRGAVPHFVDIEEPTLGLDAKALGEYLQTIAQRRGDRWHNRETGRRFAAVVPMHTFGHPVDMDPLLAVCERYGLPLVEDAAESLGSTYRGRHTGTFGRLGVVSFNGNKIVTTGGGGAVLTADPELAKAARHLTTTAKKPHAWEYVHDEIGFNYRMPNLNAALGCAQLEQLPQLLERKRTLAKRYREALESVAGVRVMAAPEHGQSNHWLSALVLDRAHAARRDALLRALIDAGLQARPVWMPMHLLAIYRHCPRGDLSTTEAMAERVVNLPSSAHLVDA